jgi:hypothetical protein
MTKMKKLLGALAVGALLLGGLELMGPTVAWATALRTLVLTTLTATTGTVTTLVTTTLTAATLATTGAISTTGASVSVSSSTSANFPYKIMGAYTTTQLATLSAPPGGVVFNITNSNLCVSSATTVALAGAWVFPSSTTVAAVSTTRYPCY